MEASISPAVRYSRLSTAYVRTRHLAELVLDCAEARDRLAELLPRAPRTVRFADGYGRAADAHRAQLEPAEVQHVERDLVALADLAEQVRRRDAARPEEGAASSTSRAAPSCAPRCRC